MKNYSMKKKLAIGVIIAAALATSLNATAADRFILGDYDKEPRVGEHVDINLLVNRISDLHANTYMFLIGHNKNDWADFIAFLPKAQKANISVWAYLLPPSETPSQGSQFQYSEPYKLDYIEWSKAIAQLSLKYPNLVGYVIDDFWKNVTPTFGVHSVRLTKEYVENMVDSGKKINPKIKFYPLMYFTHQMDTDSFMKSWGPIVDGVVAAYPASANQVKQTVNALKNVGGKALPMIVMVSGDESTLAKFNHIEGTPENIANGLSAMIELANEGYIEGVVTYCLDLGLKSSTYGRVQNIFEKQK